MAHLRSCMDPVPSSLDATAIEILAWRAHLRRGNPFPVPMEPPGPSLLPLEARRFHIPVARFTSRQFISSMSSRGGSHVSRGRPSRKRLPDYKARADHRFHPAQLLACDRQSGAKDAAVLPSPTRPPGDDRRAHECARAIGTDLSMLATLAGRRRKEVASGLLCMSVRLLVGGTMDGPPGYHASDPPRP